jgi:hypothetical protein
LFNVTHLDWAALHSINTQTSSHLVSTSFPVEPYAFNPADHLKTDFLLSLYRELPNPDKLRIIESLTKPTAFTMVAGKRAALSKVGKRIKNGLFWIDSEKGEEVPTQCKHSFL